MVQNISLSGAIEAGTILKVSGVNSFDAATGLVEKYLQQHGKADVGIPGAQQQPEDDGAFYIRLV